MAVATGTAMLIGAGLSAAGAGYAAKKQSDAAKDATRAQTSANDAALAYAKEQDAQRRADYERAYAEWQAGRQALLQRYGVSVPEVSGPRLAPSLAGPPTAAAPGGGPLNIRGNFIQNSPHLAALIASPQAPEGAPLIPRGQNLAAVGAAPTAQGEPYERWNDWRSYGLPSA